MNFWLTLLTLANGESGTFALKIEMSTDDEYRLDIFRMFFLQGVFETYPGRSLTFLNIKCLKNENHSPHTAHATDYPWPVTFETAILLTADLRCHAEMSNDRK